MFYSFIIYTENERAKKFVDSVSTLVFYYIPTKGRMSSISICRKFCPLSQNPWCRLSLLGKIPHFWNYAPHSTKIVLHRRPFCLICTFDYLTVTVSINRSWKLHPFLRDQCARRQKLLQQKEFESCNMQRITQLYGDLTPISSPNFSPIPTDSVWIQAGRRLVTAICWSYLETICSTKSLRVVHRG